MKKVNSGDNGSAAQGSAGFLDTTSADLRFAVRSLRKNLGFAFFAVALLAVVAGFGEAARACPRERIHPDRPCVPAPKRLAIRQARASGR